MKNILVYIVAASLLPLFLLPITPGGVTDGGAELPEWNTADY